ncbi:MAG: hypothetical protein IPL61_27505 [Myxococcales bacterium]|nr:hypothetical protein [Myxococcales bacterium]
MLLLDLGDQRGVARAQLGGGELGEDRQRRELDGDVVLELGLGPRARPARVAAALVERAVDRRAGHVAQERRRRARARPIGRRRDQVRRGALGQDVPEALDLGVVVEDRDHAAAAAPEDAGAAAQVVDLARDVAVDVVEEQRHLRRVARRQQVVEVVALASYAQPDALVQLQRLAEHALHDRLARRVRPQPERPAQGPDRHLEHHPLQIPAHSMAHPPLPATAPHRGTLGRPIGQGGRRLRPRAAPQPGRQQPGRQQLRAIPGPARGPVAGSAGSKKTPPRKQPGPTAADRGACDAEPGPIRGA